MNYLSTESPDHYLDHFLHIINIDRLIIGDTIFNIEFIFTIFQTYYFDTIMLIS